ncbi:MAG TPA: hypothetical protein VFP70_15060 [Burkholderiales bacterium]|nr:hypothetical protein [Burkholderiales bacterium]
MGHRYEVLLTGGGVTLAELVNAAASPGLSKNGFGSGNINLVVVP